MSESITVKLSPSYELKEHTGLWVEVDGVYHICPMIMEDKIWGKLSEDTLCGLKKIGFNREWGYRLAAGHKACKCCVEKGEYSKNKRANMQNYELVLRKKRASKNSKPTEAKP